MERYDRLFSGNVVILSSSQLGYGLNCKGVAYLVRMLSPSKLCGNHLCISESYSFKVHRLRKQIEIPEGLSSLEAWRQET